MSFSFGAAFGFGLWLAASATSALRTRAPRFGRWHSANDAASETAAAVGVGAIAALLIGEFAESAFWAVAALAAGAVAGRAGLRQHRKEQLAQLRLRQKLLLPEFLDLVMISVGAGLSLRAGIQIAVERSDPLVAEEWRDIAADDAGGKSLAQWLDQLMRKDPQAPSSRAASQLLIATERGTPVAAAMAGLAQEFRSEAKRELLEAAAKKDVQMMLPVVFGILPSVTAVALYPALTSLSALN